jgi:hypothetical protein
MRYGWNEDASGTISSPKGLQDSVALAFLLILAAGLTFGEVTLR